MKVKEIVYDNDGIVSPLQTDNKPIKIVMLNRAQSYPDYPY